MRDFRELMVVAEIFSHNNSMLSASRQFKKIDIGNYRLSVQASFYHYCEPRQTLPVRRYDAMELALFDSEGRWLSAHDTEFDDFNRIEELRERWEPGDITSVGACVPVDLIQDFCNYLETKEKTE